jgi:6-phosphogluconolactonase (cycloisomerase 2 family)
VSALAIDSTGAISLPTNSDLSLGSGLSLDNMAIDTTNDLLFVTEENSGVYPITLKSSGTSMTMTVGTVVASGTTGCAYVVAGPAGSNTIFTSDSSSVSAFTYTSSGALTLSNSQQSGGSSGWLSAGPPSGIAIDPQGQNLYVASSTDEGTWQLPLTKSTIGTPGNMASSDDYNYGPACCAVDTTNSNVVVGNGDGTIEIYSLSGGLASTANGNGEITGSTATGATIVDVAFDPSGNYLVTANGGSNDVTLFTYDSNQGAANAVVSTSVASSGPTNVVFNPDLKIVYVANGGSTPATMSAFTYGPTSLTPLNGSPFALSATVGGPSGVAIK